MMSANTRRWTVSVILLTSLVCQVQAETLPLLYIVAKTTTEESVPNLPLDITGPSTGGVTNEVGEARLQLSPDRVPGSWVTLQLGQQSGPKERTWVLISPWDGQVQVPLGSQPITIVVARWGARELLDSSDGVIAINKQILTKIEELEAQLGQKRELTNEERQKVLAENAAQYGLKPDEVDAAIRASLRTAEDPFEKGLAALYAERYPEAQKTLQEALAQSKQELGRAQEKVVERARFLGLAFWRDHRYREAVDAYSQAVELRPDDPDLLTWLGGAALDAGDYQLARSCLEKACAILEQSLGADHLDTLISMNCLALALRSQGDLAEARKLFEQVLDARTRVLGAEHPHTLHTKYELALTLRSQGDLAEARRSLKQVIEVRTRVLGAEHPETLSSMNELASTRRLQGNLAAARKLLEQVLKVRTRNLGAGHPETLSSMNELASTLRSQGKFTAARKLQEQVIKGRTQVLGVEHPETLISINNLAVTLRSQGDLAEARRLFEQVLDARTRVLGAEHPETTVSEWNLLWTVVKQNDTNKKAALIRSLSRLLYRDPAQLSAQENRVRQRFIHLLEGRMEGDAW